MSYSSYSCMESNKVSVAWGKFSYTRIPPSSSSSFCIPSVKIVWWYFYPEVCYVKWNTGWKINLSEHCIKIYFPCVTCWWSEIFVFKKCSQYRHIYTVRHISDMRCEHVNSTKAHGMEYSQILFGSYSYMEINLICLGYNLKHRLEFLRHSVLYVRISSHMNDNHSSVINQSTNLC